MLLPLEVFFKKIQTNELPDFQNAGKMCAETISRGNNVVTYLIGHFMTSQSRMPDFPDVFTVLDQTNIPAQIDEKLKQGDVLLHVGYSYYPEGILKKARERSVKNNMHYDSGPVDQRRGCAGKSRYEPHRYLHRSLLETRRCCCRNSRV